LPVTEASSPKGSTVPTSQGGHKASCNKHSAPGLVGPSASAASVVTWTASTVAPGGPTAGSRGTPRKRSIAFCGCGSRVPGGASSAVKPVGDEQKPMRVTSSNEPALSAAPCVQHTACRRGFHVCDTGLSCVEAASTHRPWCETGSGRISLGRGERCSMRRQATLGSAVS
jgi:hypothetical protein